MKKMFGLLFSLVLFFSAVFMVSEEAYGAGNKDQGYKILVKGKYLRQNVVTGYAQAFKGRIMVPYRALLNSLGVKDEDIKYDAKSKEVTAKRDVTTIRFALNSKIIKTYGVDVEGNKFEEEYKMDIPVYGDPTVNRIYVPSRFISEVFQYKVDWDAKNKTVVIYDLYKIMPIE